jgi:non-ribosomal peptide synthetase component F
MSGRCAAGHPEGRWRPAGHRVLLRLCRAEFSERHRRALDSVFDRDPALWTQLSSVVVSLDAALRETFAGALARAYASGRPPRRAGDVARGTLEGTRLAAFRRELSADGGRRNLGEGTS